MFRVIVVFVPKGAITEVILVYDLNALKNICIEMPNFFGNFAWGCQIL